MRNKRFSCLSKTDKNNWRSSARSNFSKNNIGCNKLKLKGRGKFRGRKRLKYRKKNTEFNKWN